MGNPENPPSRPPRQAARPASESARRESRWLWAHAAPLSLGAHGHSGPAARAQPLQHLPLPQMSRPFLARYPGERGLPECPTWPPPSRCRGEPRGRVRWEWVPQERGSPPRRGGRLPGLQGQHLSPGGSHQLRWLVLETSRRLPRGLASPRSSTPLGQPALGSPWPCRISPGGSWGHHCDTPDVGTWKAPSLEQPPASELGLLETAAGHAARDAWGPAPQGGLGEQARLSPRRLAICLVKGRCRRKRADRRGGGAAASWVWAALRRVGFPHGGLHLCLPPSQASPRASQPLLLASRQPGRPPAAPHSPASPHTRHPHSAPDSASGNTLAIKSEGPECRLGGGGRCDLITTAPNGSQASRPGPSPHPTWGSSGRWGLPPQQCPDWEVGGGVGGGLQAPPVFTGVAAPPEAQATWQDKTPLSPRVTPGSLPKGARLWGRPGCRLDLWAGKKRDCSGRCRASTEGAGASGRE